TLAIGNHRSAIGNAAAIVGAITATVAPSIHTHIVRAIVIGDDELSFGLAVADPCASAPIVGGLVGCPRRSGSKAVAGPQIHVVRCGLARNQSFVIGEKA